MSLSKSNRTWGKASLFVLASMLLPKVNLAGTLVASTGASDESLFMILALIATFQLVAILVIAGVIKAIASNHEIWNMRHGKKAAAIAGLLILSSSSAMAQGNNFDSLVQMGDAGFVSLIIVNLILFFTFIYLTSKLNGLMKLMMKDESGKVPETFMDKINNLLTDAVPLENEESVEMDHEYDGIRELDNNLPPWWLYMFYVCIIFGGIYLFHFHVSTIPGISDWVLLGKVEEGSQTDQYKLAMLEAEAAKEAFVATQDNVVDESNVEMLTSVDDLASGEKIFNLYCKACHGEGGGSMPGGVGPNLVDDYWIHGGSMNDIFKTIKYGVPSKGMVSWEAQLNPTKIQQVTSYIKSLKGTNPDNQKEPQGELYVEETAAPAEEAEMDDSAMDPAESTEVDAAEKEAEE